MNPLPIFFRLLAIGLPLVGLPLGESEAASLPLDTKGAPGEDDPKAPPDDKPSTESKKDASCVKVTTRARYVAGFDHLVNLDNQCDDSATCEVSTNVNPKVQVVKVPPKSQETVLTFRGSPASEFVATVNCRLTGAD